MRKIAKKPRPHEHLAVKSAGVLRNLKMHQNVLGPRMLMIWCLRRKRCQTFQLPCPCRSLLKKLRDFKNCSIRLSWKNENRFLTYLSLFFLHSYINYVQKQTNSYKVSNLYGRNLSFLRYMKKNFITLNEDTISCLCLIIFKARHSFQVQSHRGLILLSKIYEIVYILKNIRLWK